MSRYERNSWNAFVQNKASGVEEVSFVSGNSETRHAVTAHNSYTHTYITEFVQPSRVEPALLDFTFIDKLIATGNTVKYNNKIHKHDF